MNKEEFKSDLIRLLANNQATIRELSDLYRWVDVIVEMAFPEVDETVEKLESSYWVIVGAMMGVILTLVVSIIYYAVGG